MDYLDQLMSNHHYPSSIYECLLRNHANLDSKKMVSWSWYDEPCPLNDL